MGNGSQFSYFCKGLYSKSAQKQRSCHDNFPLTTTDVSDQPPTATVEREGRVRKCRPASSEKAQREFTRLILLDHTVLKIATISFSACPWALSARVIRSADPNPEPLPSATVWALLSRARPSPWLSTFELPDAGQDDHTQRQVSRDTALCRRPCPERVPVLSKPV